MDFNYENLATFYFYYGTVGHLEKNFIDRQNDAKNRTLAEEQYGEWLREDQGRGRMK